VAAQRHLPEGLEDARFYEPRDVGFEARLAEILSEIRRLRTGEGAEA